MYVNYQIFKLTQRSMYVYRHRPPPTQYTDKDGLIMCSYKNADIPREKTSGPKELQGV